MPRLVVGAVVLLLALSGCGGDPKADPSSSTSETPSPTATPSAPTMPEAAKGKTRAGAGAFVRYYVQLLNHLQSTGDENPIVAASQSACRSCKSVVQAATAIYDSGGHVEGGTWTVLKTEVSHPAPAVWTVRVSGRLAPSTVIKSGSSPSIGSGGAGNAEFVVTFGSGWKVVQWQTL